jgi:histone-lysine N-methyltransferase SETMAR
VAEVAEMLDISYSSAYVILHSDLGYRKVCAKWVPRQLTYPHKEHHVEVATQFLQHYEEDPSLVERTVTGDEVWEHHFDPEIKRQSMELKHPSSP